MKKLIYLLLFPLLLISCSKSLDDGFEDANDNVPVKLLKQLRYDNADPAEDDYTCQFGYDGSNRLISISDEEGTSFFNYDSSGNLESISGSDDPYDVSELYQSPYDAFEVGDVLEYDNNSNPSKVSIIDENYDGDDVFIGEISYDDKPSPFFYTLQAGGIIDVLDRVELYFDSSSPTIVKAYKLLPFNNISGMIFRNLSDNQIEAEVQYDTTYDEDGYATNTTVTSLTKDGTEKYYVTYIYH